MVALASAAEIDDAVQIANAVYQLLRKRLVELAAFAAEQQRVLALFDAFGMPRSLRALR